MRPADNLAHGRVPSPGAGPRHGSRASIPASGDDFIQEILDKYGRDLRNYARRLCGGNPDRAEDLVQDTLLRAWRYSASPDSVRARTVRSWLMAIARNASVDDSRARWSRPVESGPGALTRMSTPGTEDRVLNTTVVGQALACLSAEHRDVIIEVFWRGSTTAEAAAALGIPEGTVKSRAYYARQHLRQLLEEQGISSFAA